MSKNNLKFNSGDNDFTLSAEMAPIDCTRMTKPDMNWRQICSCGIKHKFHGDTLHEEVNDVVEKSKFCGYDYDGYEDYEYWLECSKCGERIEPKYVSNYFREYIAGPKTYYLDGEIISERAYDVIVKLLIEVEELKKSKTETKKTTKRVIRKGRKPGAKPTTKPPRK